MKTVRTFAQILLTAFVLAGVACQKNVSDPTLPTAEERKANLIANTAEATNLKSMKLYAPAPVNMLEKTAQEREALRQERVVSRDALSGRLTELRAAGASWEEVETALQGLVSEYSQDGLSSYALHYLEQDYHIGMLRGVLFQQPKSPETAAAVKRHADGLGQGFQAYEIRTYAAALDYLAPYYEAGVVAEMAKLGLQSPTLQKERVTPAHIDPSNSSAALMDEARNLLNQYAGAAAVD